MRQVLFVLMLLLTLSSVGCSHRGVSGPQPAVEPTISLRSDILHDVPVWESDFFQGDVSPSPGPAEQALVEQSIDSASKISKYTSPGLYLMLKQVKPDSQFLASAADDSRFLQSDQLKELKSLSLRGSGGHHDLSERTLRENFLNSNGDPLPEALKAQALTSAYMESLAAASYNANVKKLSPTKAIAQKLVKKIDEKSFTLQNFRTFGEAFLSANFEMIRASGASSVRWQRVQRMNESIGVFSSESQSLGITWDGLAFEYFAAYYKGSFVDRSGGKLSKPELGTTISNETITNAITVGLESIHDFAVLSASGGPA